MEKITGYFWVALLIPTLVCAKEASVRQKGSPHLIAAYLSPTVAEPIMDYEQRVLPDLSETERVLKAILKTNLRHPGAGGVFATYLGFVDVLQIDNFAVFPRKHAGDEVKLIVVKRMYPISTKGAKGETVERFIRKKNEPVAYYRMRRIKDEKSADFYWETTKLPIPKDLAIPPHAVVICAKPDEIFIPEVLTTAIPGPHLYLPEIFPTPHFRRGMHVDVMTFIKISPYFEPVRAARRMQKDRYAQMLDLS
ncbi:MAG: hypothetical protein M1549_00565 [Candidatus Dependentiae bacterium]|nr:hypothetical protein [Candidatus Dependentiae bacterium]